LSEGVAAMEKVSSKANLLETSTVSFSDLLSNVRIYTVPPYQRDYSWEQENWEDLWSDICVLIEHPDARHYMGAVVLQTSGDRSFNIIDGQQRFATISIIAIAVIELLRELANREIERMENVERESILKRTYLGDKDARSLKYSSKLVLNTNNNDFYQDYLLNSRAPNNIRKLSKTNKRIWDAYQFFSEKIRTLNNVSQSGEGLATFLTDIVANRLLFIRIAVEDEVSAYTVFETLNARGVELGPSDLIKNYLFSLMQSTQDLSAADRQWRRLVDTVQHEKFPDFLRYYLSMKKRAIRKDQLFKIVKEQVSNAVSAIELLENLELYSELFAALNDHNHGLWNGITQDKIHVYELSLFRVRQIYPVIFAAYYRFNRENFSRVLKLAVTISFRYNVISGLNPNELEKVYAEAAIAISSGDIGTPRQLFEKLRSIYVVDERFVEDFSNFSIADTGGARKIAKYMLIKLENDLANPPKDVISDPASLEHILPENPSGEWANEFDDDAEINEWVQKIGNLTLLEIAINRDVGNSPFIQKVEAYRKSGYALSKLIADENNVWGKTDIEKRQRQLALRAKIIWRSDFV